MSTATTHIETEKRSAERSRSKLVPALRFKEFEDKWFKIRLLDEVKISNGQVDPKLKEFAALPLIAPNHIESGTGRVIEIETAEEQNAIWEMTSDLEEINSIEFDENNQSPEDFLPHPKNYKNWFTFYDEIDLRRHFQDVEIILIEQALEKTDNKIALAADKLKLRRTTLIEKMRKYSITTNIIN